MLHSYQAVLEEGQIKWIGTPPAVTSARVIVTVLPSEETALSSKKTGHNIKRQLGFMQGEMTIPDDINWGDEQIKEMFGVK